MGTVTVPYGTVTVPHGTVTVPHGTATVPYGTVATDFLDFEKHSSRRQLPQLL